MKDIFLTIKSDNPDETVYTITNAYYLSKNICHFQMKLFSYIKQTALYSLLIEINIFLSKLFPYVSIRKSFINFTDT